MVPTKEVIKFFKVNIYLQNTTDLSQLEPLFNNLQNCTWRQGLHAFAKPHCHLRGPINNKPTIGYLNI